jgi:hypothetical protein
MCTSCAKLADISAEIGEHIDHLETFDSSPKCDYPLTCSCQHRPIKDNYVPRRNWTS